MDSQNSQELPPSHLDSLVDAIESSHGSKASTSNFSEGMPPDMPAWAQNIVNSVDSIRAGQSILSNSLNEFGSKMETNTPVNFPCADSVT